MKRKTIPKKIRNVTYNDLLKETKELVNETNKRLSRLEKGIDINKAKYNPKTKRFERSGTYDVITATGKRIKMKPKNIIKYKTNSWAGKKLNARLSTVKGIKRSAGKFRITSNLSLNDLRAVHKATTNFLKSETSTVEGINEVETRTKESLKNLVEDVNPDISSDDVNTLYSFYADKDYQYVTKYVDSSELNIVLNESKYNDEDSDGFLRRIENQFFSDSLYQDEDLVDALENIYNKYSE